jgi:hypothetical protein
VARYSGINAYHLACSRQVFCMEAALAVRDIALLLATGSCDNWEVGSELVENTAHLGSGATASPPVLVRSITLVLPFPFLQDIDNMYRPIHDQSSI